MIDTHRQAKKFGFLVCLLTMVAIVMWPNPQWPDVARAVGLVLAILLAYMIGHDDGEWREWKRTNVRRGFHDAS